MLALVSCARQQQNHSVIDPQTGQPESMLAQQQLTQSQSVEQTHPQSAKLSASDDDRGLFSSSPAYAQQAYAQPSATAQYDTPQYTASYADAPAAAQPPYTLDSGDKLRIVVFGQAGISNTYMVDASGNVSLPLIGTVAARGFSTRQLTQTITARLKQGYLRDPHVSVEIETYRPFFILGEVTNPGQYPYVANMTAETAVAIAGGFAPRADKHRIELTRTAPGRQMNAEVPLNTPLRPGDTIMVKERWF